MPIAAPIISAATANDTTEPRILRFNVFMATEKDTAMGDFVYACDAATLHLSHPAPLAFGMEHRGHRGVGCRFCWARYHLVSLLGSLPSFFRKSAANRFDPCGPSYWRQSKAVERAPAFSARAGSIL